MTITLEQTRVFENKEAGHTKVQFHSVEKTKYGVSLFTAVVYHYTKTGLYEAGLFKYNGIGNEEKTVKTANGYMGDFDLDLANVIAMELI